MINCFNSFFLMCLAIFTMPSFAAQNAYWMPLSFSIMNLSGAKQIIQFEKINADSVIETTLFPYKEGVGANNPELVKYDFDVKSLENGVELEDGKTLGLVINYAFYSNGSDYATKAKFKIISGLPDKQERVCNVNIISRPMGNWGNWPSSKYLSTTVITPGFWESGYNHSAVCERRNPDGMNNMDGSGLAAIMLLP